MNVCTQNNTVMDYYLDYCIAVFIYSISYHNDIFKSGRGKFWTCWSIRQCDVSTMGFEYSINEPWEQLKLNWRKNESTLVHEFDVHVLHHILFLWKMLVMWVLQSMVQINILSKYTMLDICMIWFIVLTILLISYARTWIYTRQ